MEARPAKSYHLVNKRRNHTITCVIVVILLSISMIILGIVKGIQKSNNNNNASNANEEEDTTSTILSSSYNGIPPPIASGDLPNVRDITSLEDVAVTGDSTIKDACVKECKLGLCCITGELNKLNDAIKEAGHTQSEDIKALLNDNDGYKVDVDDCYDKYEIKCSKYEPCLNLLDANHHNMPRKGNNDDDGHNRSVLEQSIDFDYTGSLVGDAISLTDATGEASQSYMKMTNFYVHSQ